MQKLTSKHLTFTWNDDIHTKTPITLKQNFARKLPKTIHLAGYSDPANHSELKILFIFERYFHNNSFSETIL
jgi:hypothetical protein